MRTLIAAVMFLSSGALECQPPKFPVDVLPDSYSRLPPVKRADLDEHGKQVFDRVAGTERAVAAPGPAGISLYSPQFAEPMHVMNQYLRDSVIGRRYFELSALVAAREFDQQYEWTGHEAAGLRAGLDQSVIDAVKFNKSVERLPEKESTVIRIGHGLFREHRVSSELFAKAVELFGKQGAFEISAVMGDYAMAAVILNFADQHLPPDRKPMMPEK
jgi:4-carboxymuconolactone decarboxylase